MLLAGSCTQKSKPVTIKPPEKDPARAEEGLKFADNAGKLAKEAQYRSSNYYLGRAIDSFKAARDWEHAIQCYIQVGENYQQLENFEKARTELSAALDLTRDKMGHKHLDLAKSFQKMGYKYLREKQYDHALEMYEKALIIQLEILGPDNMDVAKTYNSIALAYMNRGDTQNTNINYKRSFAIKAKQFQGVGFNIKNKYKLLDKKDLRTQRFSKAKIYFNRQLAVYRDTFGSNETLFSVIYENMGIIYAFEGDYDRALNFLQKSFALRLNLFGEESPEVGDSYHNIGICLRLKGDYKQAQHFLSMAMDIKSKHLGKDHPDVADLHYQLGKIHFHNTHIEKALDSYQKALAGIAPGVPGVRKSQNPPPEKTISKESLLKILGAKAEALKIRYFKDISRIKDLNISFQTYLLAVDLVDDIRRGYKSESYKLFFGEKSHEIYDEAIQTALVLYEMTGQDHYKSAAFSLAERSKAAVLAEALAQARALRFAGLPDELLAKEKKLKEELDFYDTLLEKEFQSNAPSNQEKVKNLEQRFYTLKGRYQELIEHFETYYQDYYNLKYNPNPTTVADLQRSLPDDTAFVEYFWGRDYINIFTMTREDLDVVSIPREAGFAQLVESFYLSIKKIEEQRFFELSDRLYQVLIGPIREIIKGKRKLIIVPHGRLYYVPFEALAPARGKRAITAADYLIKHYAVSYHYSGRLWRYATDKIRRDAAGPRETSFIGFAPVFDTPIIIPPPGSAANGDNGSNGSNGTADLKGVIDLTSRPNRPYALAALAPAPSPPPARDVIVEGKRFPRLPGTEQELRSIIKLFKSKQKEAAGYFRSQASEVRFKAADMKKYSIIHVATHSLKEDNLKLSGLLLGETQAGGHEATTEDGILYSGETYNLSLDADLIVLSSCESGIGKLVKGEGMIALNRGFLYSGVRNTIFSLWKVEDKTTSRLMIEMYRNILAGKTFTHSLRDAKLKLIRDPFTTFPKYWSAFILVGE